MLGEETLKYYRKFVLLILLVIIFFLIAVVSYFGKVYYSNANFVSYYSSSTDPFFAQEGTKYECTGICYCSSSEERRVSSSLVSRVVYAVTALTSAVAIRKASKFFEGECTRSLTLVNQCEDPSHITSDIENCELIENEADEENERKVHVILGTESPFKRLIFEGMFPKYKKSYTQSNFDEKSIPRPDNANQAEILVQDLSHRKADDILSTKNYQYYPDHINILITTDVIVRNFGEILEKPENIEDAKRMMRSYGPGSQPETVCGVVVVLIDENYNRLSDSDVVIVEFERIPENVMNDLIDEGRVLRCSGSLTISGEIIYEYIKKINGERSSVIGLPRKLTTKLVEEMIAKVESEKN